MSAFRDKESDRPIPATVPTPPTPTPTPTPVKEGDKPMSAFEHPYPNVEEIPDWFTHKQPPTPAQAEKYAAIHTQARAFAEFMAGALPMDQAESGFAFQKLEEVVYWAVTAVSRS